MRASGYRIAPLPHGIYGAVWMGLSHSSRKRPTPGRDGVDLPRQTGAALAYAVLGRGLRERVLVTAAELASSPSGYCPRKPPLYLGCFEFIHNARKRGKALLHELIEVLVK